MRRYIGVTVLALAAIGVLACQTPVDPARPADTAGSREVPRTPDGKPDLSGGWIQLRDDAENNLNKAHTNPQAGSLVHDVPPMTAWGQEQCKKFDCPKRLGDFVDPVHRCAPAGFPRSLITVEPIEILYATGNGTNRILMRFEQYESLIREIWMDGRPHPEHPDRPWMGHSIGKWDGDVLVVDTVGLGVGLRPEMAFLDRMARPRSDQLHVVERIQRLDYDTLKIDLTYEDPKAYTKPFTGQAMFEFRPDQELREALMCEDQ